MVRLFVLLVFALSTTACSCVVAQERSQHWHRRHVATNHAATHGNRIGFGFGSDPNGQYVPNGYFNPYGFDLYVHDPYRYGSFDAPDLLDDPYFRERHRYDSRYPGRYRQRRVIRRATGLFRSR